MEYEQTQGTDFKKEESRKLLGRWHHLLKDPISQLNLVKDDYGVHIFYDTAFCDVRQLETELLKTCSYFIGKLEPVLDNDLRNIYPSVDRLQLLSEVL